ncbi:hypothetical protein K438DRAFT_1794841 [Mycena galopus ATCC 62051]|nr:hypothetical protein K438DRAFT_1794841 [Mycena galopus ATCC 62051]
MRSGAVYEMARASGASIVLEVGDLIVASVGAEGATRRGGGPAGAGLRQRTEGAARLLVSRRPRRLGVRGSESFGYRNKAQESVQKSKRAVWTKHIVGHAERAVPLEFKVDAKSIRCTLTQSQCGGHQVQESWRGKDFCVPNSPNSSAQDGNQWDFIGRDAVITRSKFLQFVKFLLLGSLVNQDHLFVLHWARVLAELGQRTVFSVVPIKKAPFLIQEWGYRRHRSGSAFVQLPAGGRNVGRTVRRSVLPFKGPPPGRRRGYRSWAEEVAGAQSSSRSVSSYEIQGVQDSIVGEPQAGERVAKRFFVGGSKDNDADLSA